MLVVDKSPPLQRLKQLAELKINEKGTEKKDGLNRRQGQEQTRVGEGKLERREVRDETLI